MGLQLAFGQQNRLYSLYMFTPLAINPAYAGNQNQFNGVLVNRSQWLKIPGAPETQLLSAHMGAVKRPIGIGILVSKESIGVHENLSVNFSYAYQIKSQDWKLAFGLQGGFNFSKSSYDKLTMDVDEALGTVKTWTPNFGFGVFYNTRKFYVGLSVPYFFENTLVSNGVSVAEAPRYYFLNAGKILKVSRDMMFRPSLLLRLQKGTPVNADINATLFYKKILSMGLSYRTSGDIVSLFEMQMSKRVRFGYAYDFNVGNVGPFAGGSHELMLSYRVDLTARPCHTYF
ncbi:PorP/SprF family type IX secretion system membrane protein [Chryseolinea lacunae]|uniref:Type IX secretion system membrane protein PorP/SprF n=1 Tax=Chryseolinea lacunae TaxID=2801331 RepID=A0ABS1KJQ7_9BACT|nr:type IX secretion system membrane protein PorP/SprF [Chryseolinea lacunae]MBL0739694.1 type IX secretion system membrane protein PorP/SprF [Chryseolinea lacunae]